MGEKSPQRPFRGTPGEVASEMKMKEKRSPKSQGISFVLTATRKGRQILCGRMKGRGLSVPYAGEAGKKEKSKKTGNQEPPCKREGSTCEQIGKKSRKQSKKPVGKMCTAYATTREKVRPRRKSTDRVISGGLESPERTSMLSSATSTTQGEAFREEVRKNAVQKSKSRYSPGKNRGDALKRTELATEGSLERKEKT